MNDRDITVTLLHTNDIHSHFDAASRIAAYVADVRRSVGAERLLLLDCGDFLDRVSLETEGTQGFVNRELLEQIGYDAVLIGNNEGLTYTSEQLDALYDNFGIPVVCANMIRQLTGQPPSWMIPTWTTEKSGLRIGVIGLTAVFNDYYRLLGWEALEPISIAQARVDELRPNVDVLIVLSHLGLKFDERLAAQVDGIDVILGGHTHHLIEKPIEIDGTTICAAGKFGQYIGHLEITWHHGADKISVAGGCLPTDEFARSPDADRIVAEYCAEARERMNRPIADLSEPLALRPHEESPLATLLASAVRRATGTQIGLVNAGQLLEGLPAGIVTELMIHSLCPSPINPCAIKISGKQIVRALEESLMPEFYELEIRGFGFRGKVLGTLCVDGIEWLIDETQLPYHRVAQVIVDGEPLQADRIYDVGTLDMFTFGVGYVGLKEGTDVRYFLPEFIRDTLASALNDERLVLDCGRPRRRQVRRV
ncbi:bifunctional metallophosphatase/5'-nucleotidase [Cohnella yongneupensis]|uniref:Bifunctional metallophosphatase/5'-nucleotidase n=1 Tax=Cohnella yongneupensis TaxID=425006 RepID=A0ABW0QWJ3_9BACL